METICYMLFTVQCYLMVKIFRKIFLEYIFNKNTYEPEHTSCAVWQASSMPEVQPACEKKAG